MSGPELERETFRDLEGNVLEGIVWPEPRRATRLAAGDDHTPPLDDPEDAHWLDVGDPRRRELEGRGRRDS